MQYPNDYQNSYYNTKNSLRHTLSNKLRINQPVFHLILLILTLFSTSAVNGFVYGISILIILFAHEMGHYLMCRKYGINATLPYFIPFPFPELNPFGTLGAVIKIKDRIPNKRALFDIGVAGPLAGLFFTIPILIIGLKNSEVVSLNQIPKTALFFGESILFSQLSHIFVGNVPEGYDIMLHPMAFAGWAGLFVTGLNLLPIGQLDGGHILYALFGHRSQTVYKYIIAAFIILTAVWYPGWLLLIVLLLWFGYKHPPPSYDYVELDLKRKIIGYFAFFIFIISFIPVPLYIMEIK